MAIVLMRASKRFTYPLFGPLFFLCSSYPHSCFSRTQFPHFGLAPSHLSFRLRHTIQLTFLDLGTSSGLRVLCCALLPSEDLEWLSDPFEGR